MRIVSVIREAAAALFGSLAAALPLYIAVQELRRTPDLDNGLLGRNIPITATKTPWVLVIAAVLLILWLAMRRAGGRRGVLWGLWQWVLRVGFWWSVLALLWWVGVVVDGASQLPLSDLHWPFALGALLAILTCLLACGAGRILTGPRQPVSPKAVKPPPQSWSAPAKAEPGVRLKRDM